MYKAKHSKFRNPGILFELLTRQVTADILAGLNESQAKTLLFKYFSPNTDLGKEWKLYNFLVNEQAKDEANAEKYISIALTQRKKLNDKNLIQQKYNLIKEINSIYSSASLLKSNLKNYKLFASIYKIFENHINDEVKFDAQEILQARNFICENLYGGKKKQLDEATEASVSLYKEQSEDIRMLSYKIMLDGLNEKYKELDSNQKRLLREYINNITNTSSLNDLIVTEVESVKKQLLEINSHVDCDVIRIKINETIKQLDKVKPSKNVKDNQIMVLLLSYELIKEINTQIK